MATAPTLIVNVDNNAAEFKITFPPDQIGLPWRLIVLKQGHGNAIYTAWVHSDSVLTTSLEDGNYIAYFQSGTTGETSPQLPFTIPLPQPPQQPPQPPQQQSYNKLLLYLVVGGALYYLLGKYI